MKLSATYVRDGDWWIGYVDELPGANAQGRTIEEARVSVRKAVELIITTNRESSRLAAAEPSSGDARQILREEMRATV